ncbi:MAG: ATP-binding protein [Lacunisphaera sp.]
MVAGWYGSSAYQGRVRPSLALIAAILTLLIGAARIYVSREATIALTATTFAAGLLHLLPARGPARFALGAILLATLASGTGPLAEFVMQPRRWSDINNWSLCAALLQLATALIVTWCLLAPRLSLLREGRQETRFFFLVCVGWIGLGLGLAWIMASFTRHNFEVSALARATQAGALFDTAQLAELMNDEFKLEGVHELNRDSGNSLHGVVKRLETPLGWAEAKTLSRVERANPDVMFVTFGTIRDGWLVLACSDQQYGPASSVGLFGRNNPRDLADWQAQRTSYLRPHATNCGLQTYARAAVTAPDGRMLGWLILLFPVQTWVAGQAQARLLVFVIIALGLGLAVLLALQRRRWRERESARALANSALEADRLKTSFLAKVSHELRTPIQSILGYSELLRPTLSDAVARARLHALRQHTDLMLRLVNDLLDLSAIQAGAFRLKPQPTRLPELVRQTAESLRPRAEGKGLVYLVTVDVHAPEWALVDGERVRQIVLNLVSNAVKFTDRGRVGVRFGPASGTDLVQLEVSDSGPGIAPADRERLFQPFARLDATAAKEGTGLGLSLAAALCRSMQGQITLQDTAGVGATFVASFRSPPCLPPAASHRRPGLDAHALQGRRILVVDDNTLVRELFVAFLQDKGAHCVAAADGEAALAALQREHFDGIVLDLAMPRLDGWETARRIRASGLAGPRLIGVSAHAGPNERAHAALAGFDVFLSKPVELESLAAALAGSPPPASGQSAGSTDELIARLRNQFRGECAAQSAAVVAALGEDDMPGVQAAAHYLCNSAAVIGDDVLHAAAAGVEIAAQARDRSALAPAWQACEQALAVWINSSTLPPGIPPAASAQSSTIRSSP